MSSQTEENWYLDFLCCNWKMFPCMISMSIRLSLEDAVEYCIFSDTFSLICQENIGCAHSQSKKVRSTWSSRVVFLGIFQLRILCLNSTQWNQPKKLLIGHLANSLFLFNIWENFYVKMSCNFIIPILSSLFSFLFRTKSESMSSKHSWT